jgi:cobalt transporter subunit CbtB
MNAHQILQLDNYAAIGLAHRAIPGVLALVLGIVLIYGVGFASIGAVHNAAHDTRHAVAFPCH